MTAEKPQYRQEHCCFRDRNPTVLQVNRMTEQETQEYELPANFIEIIGKQNHYVRLGLRTNQVTSQEIQDAWSVKSEAYQQARMQQVITFDQYKQALGLIEEAYKVLSAADSKRQYDKDLARAMRKTPTSTPRSPEDSFASRYTSEDLLSTGRRAKLYSAMDNKLNRRVLIKELHGSFVKTPEQISGFRDECTFFAASNATHLVKVLDYDEPSFRVVMEWLPSDLGSACQRRWAQDDRDFTPHEIREILRQSLHGLRVLHSRGWVHSRLSLTHLLLDDHGNIKLSITPGLRETSTAAVPSSDILHIAPEMLRPDVFGPLTPASDLYVLGFIALDLITRNKVMDRINPYSEEASSIQEQWYRWHASPIEILPSTADWMQSMPDDITKFLEAITNKQSSRRPPDAAAALRLLEELSGAVDGPIGASGMESELDQLPEDFGTVHLGTPPALHDAQYDASKATGIQQLKKIAIEWLHADPQRKWVAMSGIAAILLLLMTINSKPHNPPIQELAQTEESVEEFQDDFTMPPNVPRFPEDVPPVKPKQDSKPAEATPPVIKPDENPVKTRLVSIDVQGGAIKIDVDRKSPVIGKTNHWMLEPGVYSAIVEYGKSEKLTRAFRVPEGDGPYTLSIVPPDPNATVAVIKEQPVPKSVKSFRFDVGFDIVEGAATDYDKARKHLDIAHRLIRFLSYKTGELSPPKYLNTVPVEQARDPRISFLLAVHAYRRNNLQQAEKLCDESIQVIQIKRVPFVMPYQLMAHIYDCQQGKTGLSLSLIADSIFRLHTQNMELPSDTLKGLMEEQLWVFGKLYSHARENTTQPVDSLMDESLLLEILQINRSFAANPFQQGCDAYAARLESHRPKWMDERDYGISTNAYVGANASLSTRSDTLDQSLRSIFGDPDSKSLKSHGAKSPQSMEIPAPGRAISKQLHRRALAFDQDLSFLVERTRLTLPPPGSLPPVPKS